MNFWAARLGGGQPAPQPVQQPTFQQQPVQQPQHAVQKPWWANDYSQYVQQPAQPQQAAQEALPPEESGGWGTVSGSMAKAKSSRSTEMCPECGSKNIFRPEGQPNAMTQCYECGYNPRFSQTGGAGGLPSSESGPAQPARQLAGGGLGGVSQFSPSTIIGRI